MFGYKHVLVESRQVTEVFLWRGPRRPLLLLLLLLKHQNPAEGIRGMNRGYPSVTTTFHHNVYISNTYTETPPTILIDTYHTDMQPPCIPTTLIHTCTYPPHNLVWRNFIPGEILYPIQHPHEKYLLYSKTKNLQL